MALQKNGSANRSLLRPSLFIYNVYKVQNSINHMLNPSADRDVNNIYQLSTEKARQWWNNQAFESRKNIVIESDAVINDDKLVEDQTIADIADKDYDDLPDITKQEVELQVESEDIEQVFDVEDEEYLQCSICDDVFTTNEDYELHKSVDHGEEPEDLEESEETYQLTMHPELTRESLRKANNLLTETEERQLYSDYDKNGGVQSSIMPYNVPSVATGKYNDNPNSFFYSNKIFRAGSSTERTSSLGEALEDGVSFEYIHSAWNQYFEQAGADNNHVDWLDFAQSKGINGGDAENKWNDENYTSYGFHSESKANEYGYDDVMDSVDKNMGSDRYNKLKSMVDSMSSSSRQEFVKKTLSLSPDSNGVTQFEILRSLGFSEDELIGESKASETEDYWDYRDQGDPPDDWVNWYECKTCGKSGMDDGSDSMNTVGQHRRDNPTHRVEWSNATEESYSSEGRYMIRDKDGQWQVQELTDDLELAKAIADDSSTEEISGTQPDGAKGVVVDLDFRQVVYSAEVGSEDHGCVECGFTTADNSEYLDHLNSHEE